MQPTQRPSQPFVSVIILNYNGERFLVPCLESVLSDEYTPREVLLVDNASSDASVDMARRYQDRITLVENEENYGFPRGCNQGIQMARGDILVLLNIDTTVEKGWLAELVAPLLQDHRVGIVGSKLLFPGSDRIQFAGGVMEPNGLTQHRGYGLPDDGSYNQPEEVEYITGASMAIRRDVLEQVGGLDEGFPLYFEDIDLCFRVRHGGYKVLYNPKSVVYHYETYGTQKQSFVYYYKYHRGRMRFVLKHFGVRYLLSRFLPYELGWYRRCDFSKQAAPLLLAYTSQLGKAPYFWSRGFIRRRFCAGEHHRLTMRDAPWKK